MLERVGSLVEAESPGQHHPWCATTTRASPDPLIDREQLVQAVLNIVRNAMQAASQNDLHLGTHQPAHAHLRASSPSATPATPGGAVEIIDNGPAFRRAAGNHLLSLVSGRPDGTGLGLAITQNIIQSAPGPDQMREPSWPYRISDLPAPGPRSHTVMSRRQTVWIVDDDRLHPLGTGKTLQQEGMTTPAFDSADGVLTRLTRQQPDVIISDIRMPGASGPGPAGAELATSIRACR